MEDANDSRGSAPCAPQHLYRSLINQDFEALADLYANEYMLVRPDGSVLNKEAVLHDLKLGG